ncbi:MAG: trigger factor [Chloroflexota bacterium]
MKLDTQSRDDHQVTMTVTLEQSQMESAKHRAARKISERKSVPGFRPGKAPYEVVVRTFGEGAIVEEAVDLLLDEIYPKALDEAKLEPGASGSLEKMEDLDKEPKFVFTVPLAPKVELGDYRSVRVPYDWQEPGEEEVKKSIQDLRQMYAKTETVDRPIRQGDFVLIDLKGEKIKPDNGEAPLIERTGFPVFIRTDEKVDEWPYSGFAQELLGASASETKTFSYKFPKDHADESLKGQNIKFEVTIKMVRGSILPDLNDEFAKKLGPFENIQALRDALKANLASRSKADYDDEFFAKVIEAIKSSAVIKYAPQTLEHEVGHVMEDIKSRLARQGLDLPAYLKSRNTDEEKFVAEEARPTAVKRLERSLLLDEIARVEKIELSKEQLDDSFQQTLYDVAGNEEFQKYLNGKSKPPKRFIDAIAMESANRAYLQQTLERLKAIATGQAPALGAEGKPRVEEKKAARKSSGAGKSSGEKKAKSASASAGSKKSAGKSSASKSK